MKKELIYIGIGLGIVLFLKNSVYKSVVKPALDNVDKGMDNVADFYVQKQMAWNEFWKNSDTLKERYDNFLNFVGLN